MKRHTASMWSVKTLEYKRLRICRQTYIYVHLPRSFLASHSATHTSLRNQNPQTLQNLLILLLMLILSLLLLQRSKQTASRLKNLTRITPWKRSNPVFSLLCSICRFLLPWKREKELYRGSTCYRSMKVAQVAPHSHSPCSTAHTCTQHKHQISLNSLLLQQTRLQ